MQATEKSPVINEFISFVMGSDRVSTIASDICMSCKKPATDFTDELSRKEYQISGLCQTCQDSIFGSDGDD